MPDPVVLLQYAGKERCQVCRSQAEFYRTAEIKEREVQQLHNIKV